MFIVPIQRIGSLEELNKKVVSQASESNVVPFKSIFEEAINNVKESEAKVNEEIYKLATGQTDNVHDLTIASTKATLSVDLLVQLRNKALDSYNEIMRMGV